MDRSRKTLGAWGETRAAEFLQRKGYTILERNARTPYGEIDIIAREVLKDEPGLVYAGDSAGSMIVFVEVRTRSTTSFGYPEQSLTVRKKEKMMANALAYMQEHPDLESSWRVDMIAVRKFGSGRSEEIVHFENVLSW